MLLGYGRPGKVAGLDNVVSETGISAMVVWRNGQRRL